MQELLRADSTSVRLVLTPERVVLAEARRTLTSLGLHGFAVDQVVVNRVFPDAATGARAEGRPPAHPTPGARPGTGPSSRGWSRCSESFASLPVVCSPYLDHEPIGPDDLDDALPRLHRRGRPGPAHAAGR